MSDFSASDLRPFVPARDFAASKRFYTALGWETRDVDTGLALVRVADGEHFYLQDFYIQQVAENFMLHLTVTDAQAWHQRVESVLRNGAFPGAGVQPPKLQPYGAIVTFVHDPAGVLLHLCQWQ